MRAELMLAIAIVFKFRTCFSLTVEVREVSTSSVDLEWVGPSSEARLSYRLSANASSEPWEEFTVGRSGVRIDGLVNGAQYEVTLEAVGEIWSAFVRTASCPPGWSGVGMTCYLVSDDVATREQAAAKCSNYSTAHLADPHSPSETRFIGGLLTRGEGADLPVTFYWIGVHFPQVDGDFAFSDGSAVAVNASDYWHACALRRSSRAACFVLLPAASRAPKCTVIECEILARYICELTVFDSPHGVEVASGSYESKIAWEDVDAKSGWLHYVLALRSGKDEIAYYAENGTSMTTSGLHPGHLYSLEIATLHYLNKEDASIGPSYPFTYFVTSPLPPRHLSVVDVTSQSARVTWALPSSVGNNTYNGFTIVFRPLSVDGRNDASKFRNSGRVSVDNATRVLLLDDLEPLVKFYVTMVSTSKYVTASGEATGESDATVDAVFETLVSPPQRFRVDAISTTTIQTSWEAAAGSPDGYNVTMTAMEDGSKKTFSYNSSTMEATYRDLIPGAQYRFSMTTQQQNSYSKPDVIYQRTRPLPLSEQQVNLKPSLTGVQILITKPPAAAFVYDGYNVTLESLGAGEHLRKRVDKNATAWWEELSVEGLTPGRSYEATFWVTSGEVVSTPTHLPPFTTELGSPAHLRLKARDSSSLQLEWDTAPGDYDHYIVTCDGKSGYKCPSPFVQVEGRLEVSFEDLQPGASYRFAVAAQGGKEQSDAAALTVRTLPEPPVDLRAESHDSFSVALSWSAPGPVFSGYRVAYSPVDSGFYASGPPAGGNAIVPLNGAPSRIHVVDNLMPGVHYDFTVKTLSGEAESEARRASSHTTPSPVKSLRVRDVGDTWAFITWSQGDGAAVHYQIHVKSDRQETNSSVPVEGNGRHNETGLEPSTMNYINVAAISSDGERSTSVGVSVQTRPSLPRNVTVENVTETSFLLSWLPPEFPWERFVVTLHIAGGQGDDDVITRKHTSGDSLQMEGLQQGGIYRADVESEFAAVRSIAVTRNITLYPNPPENLTVLETSTKSAFLTWQPPVGKNGGFLVDLLPRHGTADVRGHVVVLSGLTPGKQYDVTVFTLSWDGTKRSSVAATAEVRTMEAPSGRPNRASFVSSSNASIRATWGRPDNPNGKIKQYIIRYQQIFPHPSAVPLNATTSGDSMEMEVGNLEAGAGYYFTIAAQNSAGIGDFTKPRFVKLMEVPPGPVDSLSATPSSSSEMVVSWKPPRQPNGEILLYYMDVKSDGSLVDEYEFQRRNNSNLFNCVFESASALSSFLMGGNASSPMRRADEQTSTSWSEDPVREFLRMTSSQASGISSKLEREDVKRDVRDRFGGTSLTTGGFDPYCPVNFTVIQLEPYTSYHVTVKVWNSAGEGDAASTTVVTQQEAPEDSPRFLHVSRSYSRNLTISWSPPLRPNGALTYSLLLYLGESPGRWWAETNDTSVTVASLLPYHSYAAAVQARTHVGAGPWSELVFLRTAQDVPESVENLTAVVDGSRSVIISWLSPPHPHGVIVGYRIDVYDVTRQAAVFSKHIPHSTFQAVGVARRRAVGSSGQMLPPQLKEEERRTLLGTLLSNHTQTPHVERLTSLVPNTNYSIVVGALTGAGMGKGATVAALTKEDLPTSPPYNLTYANLSSTSINITWEEPAEANGAITRYVVGISRGEMVKTTTVERHLVVEGLEVFTQYEVYVWAWTSIGEGPSSVKMLVHTDEGVPESAPRNLTYKNISSRAIEVSWLPPLSPNGVVTNFTVYYDDGRERRQKNSPASPLILERLSAHTAYEISVSASTKAGEGPLGGSVQAHTMEGQPTSPPRTLAYENVTSRSVRLRWLPPLYANGIIQLYNVTLKSDLGETIRSLQTDDRKPELLITSLKPFHRYEAVVRASTKYGDGAQESEAIVIQTPEEAPESPPREARYVNVTSTSIRIAWAPPAVPNGHVVEYKVTYRSARNPGNDVSYAIVPGNITSLLVDNLLKYTEYNVTIAASTLIGYGPGVHLHVNTDEDVPSSPPYDVIYEQLSSTSIVLSWKPPVQSNGRITGYTIFYRNLTRSYRERSVHPRVTLSGLRKFGGYEAFVVASTRVGVGQRQSVTVSFKTLEDAPSDPPHNVTVEPLSSTSLLVSWQPPNTPNGMIQFYTIFYRDDVSAIGSKEVTNGTSTEVDGLRKFTLYNVWVTASTALGDGGHKSPEVEARTMEGVPDQPVSSLLAVPVNSSSIEVSWKIALPVTGETYSFMKVETTGSNQTIVFSQSTEKERVIIVGLTPFTRYVVSVTPRVSGAIGDGPERLTIVTTEQDRPTSPVRHLRVGDVTSTSVLLQWMAPEDANGVITEYLIFGYDLTASIRAPGNVTSANVTPLSPFTSYVLRVVPRTMVGPGPEALIEATTLQGVPSDPPRGVEVHNVSATTADVTWEPPLRPNGVIARYVIAYSFVSATGDNHTSSMESTTTRAHLSRLTPFRSYVVSVRAYTEAGPGRTWSEPSPFTTLESVPDAPRNLTCVATAEDRVRVSWEDPAVANGRLVGFSVQYYSAVQYSSAPEENIPSIVMGPAERQAEIGGLSPYTSYVARVRAATKVGYGAMAMCDVTTQQGYPDPPENLKVVNVTEDTIVISWQPPNVTNGIITKYSLVYSPPDGCDGNGGFVPINSTDDEKPCLVDLGTRLTASISHLRSFKEYYVSVRAATARGYGADVWPRVRARTEEGAPKLPPTIVDVTSLSPTSLDVTWEEPRVQSGVTRYQVMALHSTSGKMSQSNILKTDTRHYVIDGLDKDSFYNVTVAAITSAGSLSSLTSAAKTEEDAPSDYPAYFNISTTVGNSSSVVISFVPPRQPNGHVIAYVIELSREDLVKPTRVEVPEEDLPDPYKWHVTGLLGGRTYKFRIRAHTKVGPGPWAPWARAVMPITAPPPPPDEAAGAMTSIDKSGLVINTATPSTITVRSPCVFSDENGPVASISVIVVEEGADRSAEPIRWKQARPLTPSPPYKVIATRRPGRDCHNAGEDGLTGRRKRELTSDKRAFVVGADTSCGESPKEYCNGALKPGTAYRIKYRAETTTGAITDTKYSEPIRTSPNIVEANLHLIIGIVVPLLLFMFVFVIAIILKRRRGKEPMRKPSDSAPRLSKQQIFEEEENSRGPIVESPQRVNMAFVEEEPDCEKVKEAPLSRPVSRFQFGSHIARLCLSKNKGFSDEFEELGGLTTGGATAAADKPFNRTKNRFAKLVPYDQFRVKLSGIREGDDYVNASFIPDQSSSRRFIAAQTPLEHTRKDFWRMLWETGSFSVVVVGKELKKRSEVFWPSARAERFGSITVQPIREDNQPNWTIRHFTMALGDQSRDVIMFRLNDWPGGARELLSFVESIRLSGANEPITVACSSGCGASAVVIAMWMLLERLRVESWVDCFGVVAAMRRYRPHMVHTLDDYILLHRCAYEAAKGRTGSAPTGDGMEETIF